MSHIDESVKLYDIPGFQYVGNFGTRFSKTSRKSTAENLIGKADFLIF